MKFGETLQQRSIPQWAHYNVDYDELKRLIKERTSENKTDPVSIPGQSPTSASREELDNELYGYLYDQHERVTLFTRSKYGEIERRLDHFNKQLQQLGRNTRSSASVQQSKRFQRLVEEADSVSEDIQSLSRYTSVQRLAFKKILKKYQKWTGSFKFAMRVNNEVLNQPSSFLQPDFTPLLSKLSDLQTALRNISINGTDRDPHQAKHKYGTFNSADKPEAESPMSEAGTLEAVFRNGTKLEIDTALATVPLGQNGGRAVYWVHSDNVEDLQVLILRHMRDQDNGSRRSLSRMPSMSSLRSRHGSIRERTPPNVSDCIHVALMDDLDAFVKEQNAVTISRNEDSAGSCAARVSVHAYWNHEMKTALVATSSMQPVVRKRATSPQRLSQFKIHQIRRKELANTLQPSFPRSTASEADPDAEVLRHWMQKHPSVKPLAQSCFRRARYQGLDNESTSGIWATLNRDIRMSKIENNSLGRLEDSSDDLVGLKQPLINFPHSVLELRWENQRVPEIINILNTSYLVQRVRGFSLQTYAIYKVCEPPNYTTPIWMSLLDKDIRKVPTAQHKLSRKQSSEGRQLTSAMSSASAPSTDGPSGSGFSSNPVQSSGTSALNSANESAAVSPLENYDKRFKKTDGVINRPRSPPIGQRYWNEFDDGSESGGNDVYTIFVDPNANHTFPGFDSISKASSGLIESVKANSHRLRSWLWFDGVHGENGSRQPLLADRSRQSSGDVEDSSDSEGGTLRTPRSSSHTKYRHGRMTRPRFKPRESRETGLLRTYIGCFVAAYILLIITAILQSTGRHKVAFEVDLGVVTGVVSAVCFGIVGTSMMLLRKEKLSWLHRIAVALAFAIVCVFSGILLALIGAAV